MSNNPIEAVECYLARRNARKLAEENAKLLVACKILAISTVTMVPIMILVIATQGRALNKNEAFLKENFRTAWEALYYPGLTSEQILDELV